MMCTRPTLATPTWRHVFGVSRLSGKPPWGLESRLRRKSTNVNEALVKSPVTDGIRDRRRDQAGFGVLISEGGVKEFTAVDRDETGRAAVGVKRRKPEGKSLGLVFNSSEWTRRNTIILLLHN